MKNYESRCLRSRERTEAGEGILSPGERERSYKPELMQSMDNIIIDKTHQNRMYLLQTFIS